MAPVAEQDNMSHIFLLDEIDQKLRTVVLIGSDRRSNESHIPLMDRKEPQSCLSKCLGAPVKCNLITKIGLQLKASLENLTNLRPEDEDFRWYVRLKCANCGEETTEFQYLTLSESAALKGGRGHASMVLKCKLCSRENSIDILKDTIKPYNADDSNRFKTVIVFDCRGVEPIDFSPRVGFIAEGQETGTPFSDVDLKEGDWCDYDEKQGESVRVCEIEHKFVTVK